MASLKSIGVFSGSLGKDIISGKHKRKVGNNEFTSNTWMEQISIHFLRHMFQKRVRNNSHLPRYYDFLADNLDGCTNGSLHYLSSKNYSMNCLKNFGKPNEPKVAMLTKISTWQMLKIGHWICCVSCELLTFLTQVQKILKKCCWSLWKMTFTCGLQFLFRTLCISLFIHHIHKCSFQISN